MRGKPITWRERLTMFHCVWSNAVLWVRWLLAGDVKSRKNIWLDGRAFLRSAITGRDCAEFWPTWPDDYHR